MMTRSLKYSLPAIACVVALACSGGSPTDPGSLETTAARRAVSGGGSSGGSSFGTAAQDELNTRPVLRLRTVPPLSDPDPQTGRQVVTGTAEMITDEFGTMNLRLRVKFILCASSDSDEGDSLNWQYHWGDDGSAPFPPPATHPSPTFNSNFAGECKASHDYAPGSYTATLSVTDKHQDDNEVVGLKRDTVQVGVFVIDPTSGNMTNRISPVVSPEASWLDSLWG